MDVLEIAETGKRKGAENSGSTDSNGGKENGELHRNNGGAYDDEKVKENDEDKEGEMKSEINGDPLDPGLHDNPLSEKLFHAHAPKPVMNEVMKEPMIIGHLYQLNRLLNLVSFPYHLQMSH